MFFYTGQDSPVWQSWLVWQLNFANYFQQKTCSTPYNYLFCSSLSFLQKSTPNLLGCKWPSHENKRLKFTFKRHRTSLQGSTLGEQTSVCGREKEKGTAICAVMEEAASLEAARTGGAAPRLLDHTAACCHGGAKMALLAYSLGKREINHHFTVRNAKLISLAVVTLLLLFHAALRYYEGRRFTAIFLNV